MASCSQPPPPAIPSQPSDIELAKMLRALVLVDPSASPPGNSITIHDADVYAQDPEDLTRHLAATVAKDGQKAWYFSTKLELKSQRGKRKRRCMDSGPGVWRDEGKSKPVVIGGEGREIIGHRSLFSFVNKVNGARTGWIMHEFRLPDRNEEESPVVLCKVFRSRRRCAPNPANESATVEAQAEEEALVKAVEAREAAIEAREAAVKVREEALAAREAAVETREAAWQAAKLPAREVEGEALARRDAPWHMLPPVFDLPLASLGRSGLALPRRVAARLEALETNLQGQERNLAAREAAFDSRQQAFGQFPTLDALPAAVPAAAPAAEEPRPAAAALGDTAEFERIKVECRISASLFALNGLQEYFDRVFDSSAGDSLCH